ncbi:unknown protein [Seminavis robusta]|uniref:Uncharacterized protein n=1 Tax=Seminavis robusta TaxID=568900 RepID=A0A9N8DZ25_9STRA|nr:unknown protein [Seminavis robusta]|eukprot:Sro404_g135880.1 n/a (1460) ;mRNA; f:18754-23539
MVVQSVLESGSDACRECITSYEYLQRALNEQAPVFVIEEPADEDDWIVDPKITTHNRINLDRWEKKIRCLWIIPPAVRQVYLCKQLGKGWHYLLERGVGRKYLSAAYALERKLSQSNRDFRVKFVDALDRRFQDPGGFIVVDNRVSSLSDCGLNMLDLYSRMDDCGHGSVDQNRGNFTINLGCCGNNNLVRSMDSMGLPRPNRFRFSDDEWVKDMAVSVNRCATDLGTWAGGHFKNVFGARRDDKAARFRREQFGTRLTGEAEASSGGYAEAITLHRRKQKAVVEELLESVECSETCKTLGKHLKGHDLSCFAATEWLYDNDGDILIRQGAIGYGKQAAYDFVQKVEVYRPVLAALKRNYDSMPRNLKGIPRLVQETEDPYQLPAPHLNKAGVYYAVFAILIRQFLGKFQLSNPKEWAAGFLVIATKAGHKPSLFFNAMKRIDSDPCCHCNKHVEECDCIDFMLNVYEGMWLEEEAIRLNGGSKNHLRMQPFHNIRMTRKQLSISTATLIECGIHLWRLDQKELRSNIADYYHQICCIISMSSSLDDDTNLPTDPAVCLLYKQHHVCGIPSVGRLSAHLLIGVAAIIGIFPTDLLGHAEVPPDTGFHRIFSNVADSDLANAWYLKHGHYETTQDLLRASSNHIGESIAICEENVCQTKSVNTSESWKGRQMRDTVFPGIPYLKYNVSTGFIEAWKPGSGEMEVMEPLCFLKQCLVDRFGTATTAQFFKASWPNKKQNKVKSRSHTKQIPLTKLFSMKLVRSERLDSEQRFEWEQRNGQSIMNEIVNVSFQGMSGSKFYSLDLNEPNETQLLTQSCSPPTVLRPQSIVRECLQSNSQTTDEMFSLTRCKMPDGFVLPPHYEFGGCEADQQSVDMRKTARWELNRKKQQRKDKNYKRNVARQKKKMAKWKQRNVAADELVVELQNGAESACQPRKDSTGAEASTSSCALQQPSSETRSNNNNERTVQPNRRRRRSQLEDLLETCCLRPQRAIRPRPPLKHYDEGKMVLPEEENVAFSNGTQQVLEVVQNALTDKNEGGGKMTQPDNDNLVPSDSKKNSSASMKTAMLKYGNDFDSNKYAKGQVLARAKLTKSRFKSQKKLLEKKHTQTSTNVLVSYSTHDMRRRLRHKVISELDFFCASLMVMENGVQYMYTPPADFALFPTHESSFVDSKSNHRFFLVEEQAKLYACLAYIFDKPYRFASFSSITNLWNLPLPKRVDKGTLQLDEDGYPPACGEEVLSWRCFAIPSYGQSRQDELPTLVAVRVQRGGIAHYLVNPRNYLRRCSLLHLSRPYPEWKDPLDPTVSVPFAGIVGHNKGSPVVLWVQPLPVVVADRESNMSRNLPAPVEVKMQELLKYAPRACFEYAMMHKLFRIEGFRCLLSRKDASSETSHRMSTKRLMTAGEYDYPKVSWKDHGAPGCNKCRKIGCRKCFEYLFGRIDENVPEERAYFHLDTPPGDATSLV